MLTTRFAGELRARPAMFEIVKAKLTGAEADLGENREVTVAM